MRKIKVSYMSGHKEADEDGIISELKYKSMKLDRDYGKLYQSGMFKLASLNGCPVNLFLFLCEVSSESNLIRTDIKIIEDFLGYYSRATDGEKSYSVVVVRKALAQLKEIHLIVPVTRGLCRINPIHFWKGPKESDRIDTVRLMLEEGLIKPERC
jgi:hypothetical protein